MNLKTLRSAASVTATILLGGAAIEGWNRVGELRKTNSRLRRYISSTDERLMDSYSDKVKLRVKVRQLEAKVDDLSELIDPETNPTIILRDRILTVVGNADSPITRGQLKTRLSAPQRGRADGELEWLIERGYLTDTDGTLTTTGKKWHVLFRK